MSFTLVALSSCSAYPTIVAEERVVEFEALAARVYSVKPRNMGGFSCTAYTRQGMLWFFSPAYLRVGSLIHMHDVQATPKTVMGGAVSYVVRSASITEQPEAGLRRYIPEKIQRACQEVSQLPLFPHQLEGAGWLTSRLIQNKGAILGDDPGLGKTLTTLVAAVVSRRVPLLVVCPSSVKSNWVKEARHLQLHLSCEILDGRRGHFPTAHMVVLNYDLLKHREGQLCRSGARLIVFDEAHLLKEPKVAATHRAAVATRVARNIGQAICLSGTPLSNKPKELWRLLHLANPERWPQFEDYAQRYLRKPKDEVVEMVQTPRGKIYRVNELRAFLDESMLRREKSKVLSGLPSKTVEVIRAPLPDKVQQAYKKAEQNIIQWLHSFGAHDRALAAARAKVIVKISMLRKLAAIGKVKGVFKPWLSRFLENHPSESLVVFAYHTKTIKLMARITRAMGVSYARLKANDSSDRRIHLIEGFQEGKYQLFLVPIKAAGLGLNLQRARFALFIERSRIPSEMRQAEDRVHRLGQQKPVKITYLDAKDTIDTYIATVLKAKQKLIRSVIDDTEEVTNELGSYDDLLDEVVQQLE